MKDYYFELGQDSFGEAYHVALHGLLIPEDERPHFGVLARPPLKEKIYDFLDDVGVCYTGKCSREINRKFRLSKTAKTINKKFHVDLIQPAKERILKMAKVHDWGFPFPELATPDPKILIWQRNSTYKPHRNSSISLIKQLAEMALQRGAIPVIIGPDYKIPNSIPLVDFHKNPFFDNGHNICKQLWFQHLLFSSFGVKASVGMMGGALDGAVMFFEHKTIFFARERDAKPRMKKVASTIPGLNWLPTEYDHYLEKLTETQLSELVGIIWPPT